MSSKATPQAVDGSRGKSAEFWIVSSKPWIKKVFSQTLDGLHSWGVCVGKEEVDKIFGGVCSPKFLFFVHWSERVSAQTSAATKCVCFHMTDVPYGRGGSPLQNLIERGHRETMLSALQMTDELDAGPVYIKRPLSLEGGTAEEIYMRASLLSCQMAREIVENDIQPVPQTGEVVKFKRRTPQQSTLPTETSDLQKIFDHIRMLDANDYPRAFIEIGDLRIEFSRAALYHDGVLADAKIFFARETEEEPFRDE